MFYKIKKLFLKITSSFKYILIKLLIVSILFFYSNSAFSKVTDFERNLAYKYCDSIERNLFKGLDNERILKYKYFFSSLNKEQINEGIKSLDNFSTEVHAICSIMISNEDIEELKDELKIYLTKN